MYDWRVAVALGAVFVVTGIVYLVVQGTGATLDHAGVTMLIAVGAAMAFTLTVLLRGSGEL
jgi:hypothetical protein